MRVPEGPPRYVLRESEPYEADRDAAFLSLLSNDPGYAGRWLRHLGALTAALPGFPGPLSHARDEEASTLYGREIRRLL